MTDKYIAWAEIKGTKYPLCLTIGAADALEKEFGSLNAPLNIIRKNLGEGKIADVFRTVLKTVRPLAEAGAAYFSACAQMTGDQKDLEKAYSLPVLPSDEVLTAVLSGSEILQLWNACYAATQGGASREVEAEPDKSAKNVESAT